MQCDKQAYDSRIDFTQKLKEEVESELEKHKQLISIFNNELENMRSQNFDLD